MDAGLADTALIAVVDHAPQRAPAVVAVRGGLVGGELEGVTTARHCGNLQIKRQRLLKDLATNPMLECGHASNWEARFTIPFLK